MIRRKDFSGLATTDEQKTKWKERSNRYWKAHAKGEARRKAANAQIIEVTK